MTNISQGNETKLKTVGYEGHTLESFIQILDAHNVTDLWDVRYLPLSQYKPDFSKTRLSNALESTGISYTHQKTLGIPTPLRKELKEDTSLNRETFRDIYSQHVVTDWVALADEIEAQSVTVLMCLERPSKLCHRHFIPELLGLAAEDISETRIPPLCIDTNPLGAAL